MTRNRGAYGVLLASGAAWGLSAPMIKIATAAGHPPLAILFWQAAFASVLLGLGLGLGGRLRRMPWSPRHLALYAVVGLFGMSLPAWASYSATAFLPAGVISIVISLVPVFALPLALVIGTERFEARRFLGVIAGAGAMALLIGPEASLPDPAQWVWVPVAALAPLCYAIEGAFVFGAKVGDVNPFQTLWAGYLVSTVSAFLLAQVGGAALLPSLRLDPSVLAFLFAGLAGIVAYAGYLWLLRRAGSVFGAQVAYTVTGMGVIWAMLILDERYSAYVWGALALLFLGLFLVQPRGAFAAPEGGDVRA